MRKKKSMKMLREPENTYSQRRPTMADWRKIMLTPGQVKGAKDPQKMLKELRGRG